MTEPRAERWAGYRTAVVRIETPEVVVVEPRPAGEVDGRFPFAPGTVVHVITAYDSDDLAAPANRERDARLKAAIEELGASWLPTRGSDRDGAHVEPGVAALGLGDARAIELGRRFDQDAIYRWTAAAWELVDCATGDAEAFGWTRAVD